MENPSEILRLGMQGYADGSMTCRQRESQTLSNRTDRGEWLMVEAHQNSRITIVKEDRGRRSQDERFSGREVRGTRSSHGEKFGGLEIRRTRSSQEKKFARREVHKTKSSQDEKFAVQLTAGDG
jgi:hypothetical protein